MTRITLSIIFAIIFIVASFSKPMIPCINEDLSLCKLEGEQKYFGTNKLSNPLYAGLLTFIIVLLLFLFILNLIFPKKRLVI